MANGDNLKIHLGLDAGDVELLDHILSPVAPPEEEPVSDLDLLNHVLGIKHLPRTGPKPPEKQSGSPWAQMSRDAETEWERQQHEDRMRVQNTKLPTAGVANDPVWEDDDQWTRAQAHPYPPSSAHVPKRSTHGLRR